VNWSETLFEIPSEAQKGNHPKYNNYSYGLDALYSYHRSKKLTPYKIRELYPQRKVIFLIGQEDCAPDKSMSTHPSAMIQGRNRLERGKIYYGHLVGEFGRKITKNQKLHIIKGVGHNAKGIILSTLGRESILRLD